MRTQKTGRYLSSYCRIAAYAHYYTSVGSSQTSVRRAKAFTWCQCNGNHLMFLKAFFTLYLDAKIFRYKVLLKTHRSNVPVHIMSRLKEKYKHLPFRCKHLLWNSTCHYMKQVDVDTDLKTAVSHWTAVTRIISLKSLFAKSSQGATTTPPHQCCLEILSAETEEEG